MNASTLTNIQVTVNKYFRLFVFLVIFVILVAGWLVLLAPKYRSIQQTSGFEYKSSTEELAAREQYVSELKQLENDYNQLNHNALQRLGVILPTQQALPELFEQIEDIAHQQGLSIRSIDASSASSQGVGATGSNGTIPATEQIPKGIQTVDVAMQVEGIHSYQELRAFLTAIEKNMRLLDVKALQYEPNQEAYAFNMRTYYLEE